MITRLLQHQAEAIVCNSHIVVLVGGRASGKTFLLQHIAENSDNYILRSKFQHVLKDSKKDVSFLKRLFWIGPTFEYALFDECLPSRMYLHKDYARKVIIAITPDTDVSAWIMDLISDGHDVKVLRATVFDNPHIPDEYKKRVLLLNGRQREDFLVEDPVWAALAKETV